MNEIIIIAILCVGRTALEKQEGKKQESVKTMDNFP